MDWARGGGVVVAGLCAGAGNCGTAGAVAVDVGVVGAEPGAVPGAAPVPSRGGRVMLWRVERLVRGVKRGAGAGAWLAATEGFFITNTGPFS